MESCSVHKWFVTVFNFKVNKGGMGAGDGWAVLDDSGSIQEHVSVVTGWYCVRMIFQLSAGPEPD